MKGVICNGFTSNSVNTPRKLSNPASKFSIISSAKTSGSGRLSFQVITIAYAIVPEDVTK